MREERGIHPRTTSVAMSGSQAGGDRFVLYGYDNRHELTSAKWYNGTDTTVTLR